MNNPGVVMNELLIIFLKTRIFDKRRHVLFESSNPEMFSYKNLKLVRMSTAQDRQLRREKCGFEADGTSRDHFYWSHQ